MFWWCAHGNCLLVPSFCQLEKHIKIILLVTERCCNAGFLVDIPASCAEDADMVLCFITCHLPNMSKRTEARLHWSEIPVASQREWNQLSISKSRSQWMSWCVGGDLLRSTSLWDKVLYLSNSRGKSSGAEYVLGHDHILNDPGYWAQLWLFKLMQACSLRVEINHTGTSCPSSALMVNLEPLPGISWKQALLLPEIQILSEEHLYVYIQLVTAAFIMLIPFPDWCKTKLAYFAILLN